jgi:hypothetical protein
MKQLTKDWLSAVCVISMVARFTTLVATGLSPRPHPRCFSCSGNGPRGRGYSGRSRQ